MVHVAKLVEAKAVGDDGIAILVRCCEDPTTDSWHTRHAAAAMTEADIDAWKDECLTAKEQQHAGLLGALAYVEKLKGKGKSPQV